MTLGRMTGHAGNARLTVASRFSLLPVWRTCKTFTWKALRIELSQSAWLEPGDDIDSQRGLVATALAVTERMTLEVREVSWRPLRLVERDQRAAQSAVSRDVLPDISTLRGTTPDDGAGGSLVLNPVPPPMKPRGGLAAARVQEESLAW